MSDPGVTAKVRVILEVEFDLTQPWSDKESLSNMRDRAHRDAREMSGQMVQMINQGHEHHEDKRRQHLFRQARVVATGEEVTMVLPRPAKDKA